MDDQRAWAERLYAYAVVITRDPESATDAVRDALGAAAGRSGPTDPTLTAPWHFALARTEVLRQLRARTVFVDTVGSVNVADGDPFDGMTPGERDALTLALRDDLTPAEGARAMGCGLGEARSRVGAAQASWTEIARALLALRTPTTCPDLAELGEEVAEQGGVLVRSGWRRVSDHARECPRCSTIVEPQVGAALSELALPEALNSERLMAELPAVVADSERVAHLAERAGPWQADGFPEPIERADHDPRSWLRRAVLLAAVSAVLMFIGLVVLAFTSR